MQTEQLRRILNEYPMSMRLNVIVDKTVAQETTIIEMLLKLGDVPDESLVSWCGFSNCIIRERNRRVAAVQMA